MRSFFFLSLILLLSICRCEAQKISAQQIWDGVVNRYWVQREAGRLELARPEDEGDLEFSMINFRSNGTLHERLRPACGRARQTPYSGAWRIAGDTIIVSTYQGHMFHYRITGIGPTAIKYE